MTRTCAGRDSKSLIAMLDKFRKNSSGLECGRVASPVTTGAPANNSHTALPPRSFFLFALGITPAQIDEAPTPDLTGLGFYLAIELAENPINARKQSDQFCSSMRISGALSARLIVAFREAASTIRSIGSFDFDHGLDAAWFVLICTCGAEPRKIPVGSKTRIPKSSCGSCRR
jgi:hypothetical protein